MISATIKINRPIVAKIVKGVNQQTAEKTGVARVVEKAIILGKGVYVMTRILGKSVIHVQSERTREKYRAFVDDFQALRESGSIELVGAHKPAYIPLKDRAHRWVE